MTEITGTAVDCYTEAVDLTCRSYAYFYNRDPSVDGFTRVPVIDGIQAWPRSGFC